MAQEPEADDSTGPSLEREAPAGQARPPRPLMSDRTPAPVQLPVTPEGPMKVSRSLWVLSFVIGLIALLFAFLSRDERLERLRQLVGERDPAQEPETLEAVAALAFWGSLIAVLLVIAIEALLLRVMMRRRGWPRWVLFLVLFIHAGVVVLANSFLAEPGLDGIYLRLLLGVPVLLAGAALFISILPGAGRWFRPEHKPGGNRAP